MYLVSKISIQIPNTFSCLALELLHQGLESSPTKVRKH
jgi:hypothetical protein